MQCLVYLPIELYVSTRQGCSYNTISTYGRPCINKVKQIEIGLDFQKDPALTICIIEPNKNHFQEIEFVSSACDWLGKFALRFVTLRPRKKNLFYEMDSGNSRVYLNLFGAGPHLIAIYGHLPWGTAGN